jgi:hypothetical protein
MVMRDAAAFLAGLNIMAIAFAPTNFLFVICALIAIGVWVSYAKI